MARKSLGVKSHQNRRITEACLLGNGVAREALEKLVSLNVDRRELLEILSTIPFVSDKPLRLIDGMEDSTVRRLPGRIRSWADTIEKVNASPSLNPQFLTKLGVKNRNPEIYPEPLNVILTPDLAKLCAKSFESLPWRLRLFADSIKARLEVFYPTGKRKRDLGFRNAIRPQRYFTLKLLRLVRDSAHRPCYREISHLLVAAYDIAGKPRPRFISEDNLPKLEKRNSWITWVLSEFGPKQVSISKPSQ